ncbi:Alcohol dehydrogenase GroES domain protein [Magnetococcus marinus MC-1]|uniref:Alcohol dehydrogenase GroES domain protein n=1 Tax=Magnetococcus marinus (strain ATCC BAA-1437 / JCM 17883 / MC-1) TaxID=156889 RepID=A0LDI0_MAGMM|nr:alcohol dehydrogenase catalytic domain-containing protein [Magnetococcus marinus]ABK46023.1 Alcohol dehydrogenase GroES domain protein [Magnetococcus marinus MC-1]
MPPLPATMTGIWFNQGQAQLRHDLPLPQPAPHEALIHMQWVGLCHTDWDLLKGYKNFTGIPGHEFVGRVIQCQDQTWMGKRVVGAINSHCGHCRCCLRGAVSHCEQRNVLGILNRPGALAEFLTLPLENLYELPHAMRDKQAVFTEPLAAAGRIVQQAPVTPGEAALVIGDGKLGLLVAQVLAMHGAVVRLVGRHPQRWEPLHRCGVEGVLVDEITVAPLMDRVVVCGGGDAGLRMAQAMVRPTGLLMIKSTFDGVTGLDLNDVVIRELRVMGSRCGDFAPALAWLAQARVETDFLIEGCFGLTQAEQALAQAFRPGVLKILVQNDLKIVHR